MNALESLRELGPSSSVTHYAELKITVPSVGVPYQFFMVKKGKTFMPVVGLVLNNVVSWLEVDLTDLQMQQLKTI